LHCFFGGGKATKEAPGSGCRYAGVTSYRWAYRNFKSELDRYIYM